MANKLVLCIATLLVIGILPPTAKATMELYLSDATGDPYQVTIHPGESLQVQVGYATLEETVGLDYWLQISSTGSGKFTITDRIVPTDGRFTDLITTNTEALASAAALLDTYNDRNLGAVNSDPTDPESPGLYVVATLTITAASDVAPGTYTLGCWQAFGSTPLGDAVPMTVHGYTIVVTDGSSGGDTGDDSTDTGPDTGDTTDNGTADTGTGDQTTDSTDSGTTGDSQGTTTETTPVVTTARCGTGTASFTAMSALWLGMWLVYSPRKVR